MTLKNQKMEIQTVVIIIMIGIAAGILSGLVGVGGGIVIVPALIYFIGFSQKTAQGTSLAMIMLPVGILGVLQYYKQGHVDVKIVGLLAVGFIAGSFFGSKIALSISQESLKKAFAVLMILIAIKMLFLDKPKKNEDETKQSQLNVNKMDGG
jgi:hypothetical protein